MYRILAPAFIETTDVISAAAAAVAFVMTAGCAHKNMGIK